MARGRVSDWRPKAPFVPTKFHVQAPVASKTRTRAGQEVTCFDVVIRADGRRYLKRIVAPGMTKAAVNANYVTRLRQDHLRGWAFDPETRSFIDPDRPAAGDDQGDARPTVLTEALRYMGRRWPELEPRTRQGLERALRRATLWLLRPEPDGTRPEPPDQAMAWVRQAFSPPVDPRTFPPVRSAEWDGQHRGEAWFLDHSMPFEDVTTQDLVDLLDHYRTDQRSGSGRTVDPATERHFVANLRPFWRDTVDRLDLAKNPWDREVLRQRGAQARRRARGTPAGRVDRDVVLSYAQVRTLAACCAHYGSWGPRVICYTLLMGWSGLRPGEAAAVRISNLELAADGSGGWVTVDRARRMSVTERWFDAEEDPTEGPLKGRPLGESRRVPLSPECVGLLRTHIELFCFPGNDLLFADEDGQPWDPDRHWEQVWRPARAALFPESDTTPRGRKLSRLRRHDLRHAACSAWLNAGVSPKVAQQWSGHAQLSVFLDVYQGVIEGEVGASLARWQSYVLSGGGGLQEGRQAMRRSTTRAASQAS